jgi:hypothetical protein
MLPSQTAQAEVLTCPIGVKEVSIALEEATKAQRGRQDGSTSKHVGAMNRNVTVCVK